MDAKTFRTRRQCGATETHLVSRYRHQLGPGLVAVGDKANEITASDDLLAHEQGGVGSESPRIIGVRYASETYCPVALVSASQNGQNTSP